MDPQQQQNQTPQPQQPQPQQAQPSGTYPGVAPAAGYTPDYLDSIAAAPQRKKFLSGSFGKLFWVLIALFVIGVSLVIASSGGKSSTADLEQLAVRVENIQQLNRDIKKSLKSKNLINYNQTFNTWLLDTGQKAGDLLKQAKVAKGNYNKNMVKTEKNYSAALKAKFEEARLAATLNNVYASSMSSETGKILNVLNTIAKKNSSSKIRQFAKDASVNLSQIQKNYESYIDDGN